MKILLLLEMCFFCHIELTRYIASNENVIEVPPAIYEHLMFYDNNMYVVGGGTYGLAGDVRTTMLNDNGKYYLRSIDAFSAPAYKYLIGFYILKDI